MFSTKEWLKYLSISIVIVGKLFSILAIHLLFICNQTFVSVSSIVYNRMRPDVVLLGSRRERCCYYQRRLWTFKFNNINSRILLR
jgi:hypothetical protein